MKFALNDVFDELCEMYPEVAGSSIRKICKTGLTKIRSYVIKSNNFLIKMGDFSEYIFFRPKTPEKFNKLIFTREARKARQRDEASNS